MTAWAVRVAFIVGGCRSVELPAASRRSIARATSAASVRIRFRLTAGVEVEQRHLASGPARQALAQYHVVEVFAVGDVDLVALVGTRLDQRAARDPPTLAAEEARAQEVEDQV